MIKIGLNIELDYQVYAEFRNFSVSGVIVSFATPGFFLMVFAGFVADIVDRRKIIIVANDVPKEIFSYWWYKDKVIKWEIPDVIEGKSVEQNRKTIKMIMKKIDSLVKNLERKK